MEPFHYPQMLRAALLATTMMVAPQAVRAQVNTLVDGNDGTLPLPDGQYVTPTATLTNAVQQPLSPGLALYPNFVAGEAVRSRLSPDGNTLAIICAGQNSLYDTTGAVDTAHSTQYIFIYDVSGGNKTSPKLSQVIKQPNAHVGLVFSPDGTTLYGTGGSDDAVYVYTKGGGGWSNSAKIPLGHITSGKTTGVGLGLSVEPNASGLGISSDGKTLAVANNFNDSISVIDTASKTVRYEHDLRPYFGNNEGTDGVPGGEYPFAVVVKDNGYAYVSSYRDREVVVVDISGATQGKLVTRIKVDGNASGMTFNATQSTLYVAQDNADEVAIIDTGSNKVTGKIDARAPAGMLRGPNYTGSATFSVTISPDQKTLYAVNDGSNNIAVIPLTGSGAKTVTGLIPTAYAPKDITFSADGTWMYIINGKSDTGPNPGYLLGNTALITHITYPGGNAAAAAAARAKNEYQFQLEHATLVSAAVPSSSDLAAMTTQVAKNNFYSVPVSTSDAAVMDFIHRKVQHVIYVVKENRTFDQMLGDLTNGADADPSLVQFGKSITPNFHRISNNFVTLDNFMDPGDGSMDGWSWSMRGRVTSTEEITQQINYAAVDRGLSYESEGANRNVPVGLPNAGRDAATKGVFSSASASLPGGTANLLPGTADVAGTDSPIGVQEGHLFDAVLKAGLTVRNYGWQTANIGAITYSNGNPIQNAGEAGVVQVTELNPTLVPLTDVYFRGFDQNYSDQWDVNEWMREFQEYIVGNNLPALETVRLSHDHTGSFATALAGVNTPDTQEADNDLAVGRLIEAVANSPYANNTVIFVTEDDCQDGPDHVDSHRATAYVVGAYVKKKAIINTRYNQVNLLRTIEDILGTPHINLNTAYQSPMADVFNTAANGAWSYTAVASTILKTTSLALADIGVKYAEGPDVFPRHDAAYWAKVTRGFDFSGEDRVPVNMMNEVMWAGLMDGKPYPTDRSGKKMGMISVTEN